MSVAETTISQIEQFVGDWVTEANVPGASIAISHEGELVYASGFGSRDLDTNEPATADTLYGVASVSKSFAALGVLILEERGELSVADSVNQYLPELSLDDEAEPITIHELLTHSSGVPSLKTSEVLLSRLTDIEELGVPLGDREDFYRHVNGATNERTDEDYVMYNNSGYILLGQLIEELTGQQFAGFIEEEILSPLGMTRSTFDPGAMDDDAMTPHLLRDGVPEATPFPHRELSYAAGGLLSSVTELTNYLLMNQNGGSYEGAEILPADRLAKAHEGHVPRAGNEYGYGWERTQVGDRLMVGHGGSLGVSSSYVGFTPDGAYTIAIGANTLPSPTPPTVAEGILALLGGKTPSETVPYYKRKSLFEELTGEYESYRGITQATVEEHGGVLQLTTEHTLDNQSLLLIPTDPEDPGYEFEIPTETGVRKSATFEPHEEHVDLFYDRNRLHKR